MKIFSFLLLNFLLISSALSQISGKIEGYVKDEKSEPLPGANVSIEGTMSGASTDLDGKFVILNVRPGVYTLRVQFIGFTTVRVQNVQVIADGSSKINVTLKTSAINLGEEVVVTAERPLVSKDLTSKVVTLTGSEIRQLSVNNIEEILATQPGVSILSGTPIAKAGYNAQGIEDFRLRGGRNNEVGLYIDGVKVSNPVFGGFGTHLNNTAIQQLSIVSGGFNAKYGNALSGMINLTTKEAGEKPSGSLSYESSMPFGLSELSWGAQQAKHRQNIQGTFGARIPGLPGTSLFLSGEVLASAANVYEFDNITWNDYRTIHPGDTSTFTLPNSNEIIQEYLRSGSLDSIAGNLAANWDEVKGPDGREINPLDQFAGWKGLGWDNSYNLFAKIVTHPTSSIKLVFSVLRDQRYRQGANYDLTSYRFFYNMLGQNVQIFHSQKETIALTHILNSKTFYTFHVSRFVSDRKIRILKSLENRYKSQWNIFEPDWNNVKTPEEHIPYLGAQAVWDPFETQFYLLADNRWHSGDKSITYEARSDFTHQVGKSHQIELGAEYNQIDLSEKSYQNITSVDPFPTIYTHQPVEAAAYAQLKLDFNNFILNAGLRLDYFNAKSDFWNDPLNPLAPEQVGSADSLEYNEIIKSKHHLRLGPRVGLAYPLTERAVLFFNFGHFYQAPNYRDLYRASGVNREMSLRMGNLIGNPHLEPEQSIQYEIGWQQQVQEDWAIKINLWAKETTNQVSSLTVPAYSDPAHINPFTYSVFVNDNFGSAYGMDIELKKKMSHHFGGTINYSYSQASVLDPTSWDGYWNGDTENSRAKQSKRAPWDQPHVIRASLTFYTMDQEGPAIFGSKPFENITASVLYFGESGFPYTPIIDGNVVVEPLSERWPFSHQVDLKISKNLNWFNQTFRLSMQVKNLFDRKNIMTGYYRTGDPEDPGTSSYYTLSSSYWNARNLANYRLRRIIYFGLEYLF